MKKVIGIYCGDFTVANNQNWDSDYVRKNGAGGSETWAVELASAFQKKGFHAIIFGMPDCWHFDSEGVEYVPYWMFQHRCEYQHFDYLISSRRIEEITPYLECHNIYIMSHEIGVFNKYWGNFATFQELKMDKVKKIAVLSEWHKEATKKLYPELTNEQLFITCNGIDQTLYQGEESSPSSDKKKNMMVWSSCLCRGLEFFGKFVFPKIRTEVPDFEVKICSYDTNIYNSIPSGDGLEFIGTLNKKDLANLQKESKIWILPNYGRDDFGRELHESFCITAVENGMAGNAIVCLNKDGLTTTLKGYEGIINADFFNEYSDYTENDLDNVGTLIANEAIHILKDNNYRIHLATQAQEIVNKYTWEESANTWLKEWGLIYG